METDQVLQRKTGVQEIENKDKVGQNQEHHEKHEKHTFEQIIGPLCNAPHFLKDQYIKHGYRINFKGKKDVVKSLFMWHNELINIWTHLIGAIIIISLVFYVWFNYDQLMRPKAIESFNQTIHEFYDQAVAIEEEINSKISSGYDHLKDDVILMQEQFNIKLKEITHFIQDVTTEYDFHEMQHNIANAFNWQTLQWKHNLLDIMKEYKMKAVEVIGDSELDWIDLYLQFQYFTGKQEDPKYIHNKLVSRWPILAFLISAIMCLGCSTTYHLFYCLSESVNKVLIRLDYAGICFLISGSTIPPLFYGFQCSQSYAIGYALLQGLFASALFGCSLFDFFHTEEWRSTKNKMFACLGLTSAIPLVHFAITDTGLAGYSFQSQFPYYAAMAASYLIGLYIYSVRFPEKHLPGKFDNCGQSHQIWHVSVVIAILFTYVGSLNAYYTRIDTPCKI